MADRLETLLEPGETVLYRAQTVRWKKLVSALIYLGMLSAMVFGIEVWMDRLGREYAPQDYLLYLLIIAPALSLMVLEKFEVMVTDCRLLLQSRLFKTHTVVVPIYQIAAVRGLAPGDHHAFMAETIDGKFHSLLDLPKPRAFARALSKAAGLPVPPAFPSLTERVAGILELANYLGPIAGGVALPLIANIMTFSRIDPDNMTALGFIALGLSITLAVPVVLGVALGWLTGNLLALAYLRPLITGEELRAAFRLLDNEAARLRLFTLFPWAKRLQLRLAGWVYGEAMGPEKASAETGSMETNGV